MKSFVKKHAKKFVVLGTILFALAFIFIPSHIREQAQINRLLSEANAQYVDSQVARYEANLREWTEGDARAILGGDDGIKKETHYPEINEEDLADGVDLASIEIEPLILYTNDSGEEVALVDGALVLNNRAYSGDWPSVLYYAGDIQLLAWDRQNLDPFFKSETYLEAEKALYSKLSSISVAKAPPALAAYVTQDSIKNAVKLIQTEFGAEIDSDIDEFVFIEVPQMLDGIPLFSDYREGNHAVPPGISAAVSGSDVVSVTVFGEYVNCEPISESARILRVDEFIDTLPDRINRAVRSSAGVRLQYVAFTTDETSRYEIVPCWSFYSSDGQLLFDIDATTGVAL